MGSNVAKGAAVIIVLGLYANELGLRKAIVTELTQLAHTLGLSGDVHVVPRLVRSKKFQEGSAVLAIDLARLGNSSSEVLKTISWLQSKNASLFTQDGIFLKAGNEFYTRTGSLLEQVSSVGRISRSRRIREALFLSKERGGSVGRPAISAEIRESIVRAYEESGSIRATAQRLRDSGIQVGKSTVQAVVARYKKGRNYE